MIYTDEEHQNVLKMHQAIARVRELGNRLLKEGTDMAGVYKKYGNEESHQRWLGVALAGNDILKALDGEQE